MEKNENLRAIFNRALDAYGLGNAVTDVTYERNPLYGPLYNIVSRFCSDFANQNYIDVNRKFYFDFIDEGSLNAYAFSVENDDFVAITTGTVDRLISVFHRMVAHDKLFPELPPDAGVPPYGQRAVYALILLHIALGFLIGHETGHILNGHTRLGDNGKALHVEYAASTSADYESIRSHALEMDADCSGVHLALSIATFARANWNWTNFSDEVEKSAHAYAFGDPSAVVRTVLFAIYTVFLVIDTEYPVPRSDWLQGSHPPAQIRGRWAVATVLEEMKNRPELGFSQEEYSPEIISEISLHAECAYQITVRKAPLDEQFQRSLSESWDAGREHLHPVKEAWASLRPRLEPLKLGRGKLPA